MPGKSIPNQKSERLIQIHYIEALIEDMKSDIQGQIQDVLNEVRMLRRELYYRKKP